MHRITLAFLLVAPSLTWAGTERRPQPPVDWSAQVARAVGGGAPDLKAQNASQARLGAEKAALLEANEHLLAQVTALSFDGARTLGEVLEKPEQRTRLVAVVKGATIATRRYFSDSGVVLELALPLARLTELIDPDGKPAPLPGKADAPQTITGLIIDARGLKRSPSLTVKVVDAAGVVLYSLDSLAGDARKQAAAAVWVDTLEQARQSRKAGERPLVLTPTTPSAAAGVELKLTAEDAQRLVALNTAFLADGKVVIVIGAKEGK